MSKVIEDLRKFNRSELIDIISDYQKNEKRLNDKISSLEKKLSSRLIIMDKCGNIADAALSMNKIFEASQAAADQYYESVKAVLDIKLQEIENQAQKEIEEKLAEAQKKADQIIEEARERALKEEAEIDLKIKKLCEQNPGLNIKRSN